METQVQVALQHLQDLGLLRLRQVAQVQRRLRRLPRHPSLKHKSQILQQIIWSSSTPQKNRPLNERLSSVYIRTGAQQNQDRVYDRGWA